MPYMYATHMGSLTNKPFVNLFSDSSPASSALTQVTAHNANGDSVYDGSAASVFIPACKWNDLVSALKLGQVRLDLTININTTVVDSVTIANSGQVMSHVSLKAAIQDIEARLTAVADARGVVPVIQDQVAAIRKHIAAFRERFF